MRVFAELVRLLLGETAISKQTLECGRKLVILGMQVSCLLGMGLCMLQFVLCP